MFRKGVEDSQRARRRRHVMHRERTDSMSSSSVYFTASQGASSPNDGETSEGGYVMQCGGEWGGGVLKDKGHDSDAMS